MADVLAFWLVGSTIAFGLLILVLTLVDKPRSREQRFLDCVARWAQDQRRARAEEREKLVKRDGHVDTH